MSIHNFSARQNISRVLLFLAPVLAVLTAAVPGRAATVNSTTTTLAFSPTSVTAGSAVTLTATVTSGGTPLPSGQVVFCNASSAHCDDSAVLGTVWVTKSGTAILRRTLPTGTTNITAVFQATNSYAASSSGVQAVVVSGQVSATSVNTFPTLGQNPAGIVSGDFNNDGYPDLAVIDGTAETVQIFLGNGNGTFNAGASISLLKSGYTPSSITTADFNGDGNADVFIGFDGPGSSGGYVILAGNGDGTFTTGTVVGGYSVREVKVADFNHDGHADIALFGSAGLSTLLGNGDGTFTASQITSTFVDGDFAIGDFNGDGIPDVVTTSPSVWVVDIMLGNGDGTFTEAPGGTTTTNSLRQEVLQ